jgi:thiamine-phosphate pyrophosphorylase
VKLDPFYLIVDSAEWIARLVPLGVTLVQLRIKDSDEATLRAEFRAAKAICGSLSRKARSGCISGRRTSP